MLYRERTIRARTDTIRYEYSSVHNGRYRYEYSMSLEQAGRLENAAHTQWVAHSIEG